MKSADWRRAVWCRLTFTLQANATHVGSFPKSLDVTNTIFFSNPTQTFSVCGTESGTYLMTFFSKQPQSEDSYLISSDFYNSEVRASGSYSFNTKVTGSIIKFKSTNCI